MGSQIILFLVSSSFMASNYIHDVEISEAIKRHEKGEVKIVPIIIRPCDYQSLPLSKYQGLPKDFNPISKWDDRDDAWLDVVNGIKKLLKP